MSLSILDYGAGNLRSITNLLEFINIDYSIINSKKEIEMSEVIILPGVGHFGQLMECFSLKGLIDPLVSFIKAGKPYLGICLGMQILFDSSEEAPECPGLGIFRGKVIRFTKGKVPQIGWNKIKPTTNTTLLKDDYVYFVNSYCVQTDQAEIIAATTSYYDEFVSAVQKDKLLAMQFHPEKSGQAGCEIIKRWLNHVN